MTASTGPTHIQERRTVGSTQDLDSMIAKHATTSFDDSTSLLDAGLESLSLLRLAAEVATDDDAEIDATRLVELRTVGDLKTWLREIAPPDTTGATA